MNYDGSLRITIGTAIEVIKKSGKEYSKYIYFLNGCLATFIATFSFINFSVQYYIFEKIMPNRSDCIRFDCKYRIFIHCFCG